MSADWPYNCDMVPSSSMGLSSSAVCEGNEIGSSSSASDSMMNSGLDSLNWSAEGLNVGFFGIDLGNSASSLTMLEHLRGSSEVVRPMFDNEWNPLSQFPADSGFIEGTSRFSCFGGGNFSDMNPFTAPKSSSPHSKCGPVAGPDIVDGWRSLPFESEVNMVRTSKLSTECEGQNGSLPINESVTKSLIESKHGRDASSNESKEANFRGSDGQEEPCKLGDAAGGTRSARRSGTNNRKRAGQSARAIKINGVSQKLVVGEPLLKCEHKPSAGANSKADEKLDQKSQGTYTPKDDYVHVRARSGQATNSHSLAERVRREKISDRMKFLQDLVPGCSQVTGKAVMLDEIINYVESLQRQVVFLSMKLATVSSRLDFDIEGLLTKGMFQQPAGPSSSLRLPPDVGQHLIPSQTAEFQTSLPISGSSHLAAVGYIEPNIQLADTDNELHNVILVGFGVNSGEPSKCQELNDSHQSDPMKTELGRPT